MGKRDRLWKKLWVLALCGVMAMEPAAACAEEPAEAMNAADAQADVSMELPEEVENDIVEEMDEAVAEIPSEAGTDPFCGSGFGSNERNLRSKCELAFSRWGHDDFRKRSNG